MGKKSANISSVGPRLAPDVMAKGFFPKLYNKTFCTLTGICININVHHRHIINILYDYHYYNGAYNQGVIEFYYTLP